MERIEDHWEVACACDATGLFTAPYMAMLDSLGKLDQRGNFAVLMLGLKSLLDLTSLASLEETVEGKPGFAVTEEAFEHVVTMMILAGLTHLDMTEVGICGQISKTVNILREMIPLTVDEIVDGERA